VLDVQNPQALTVAGSVSTGATVVSVSGSRAYLLGAGSGSASLKVVDIGNPRTGAHQRHADRGAGPGGPRGLVFVATPGPNTSPGIGVSVFDVRNVTVSQGPDSSGCSEFRAASIPL